MATLANEQKRERRFAMSSEDIKVKIDEDEDDRERKYLASVLIKSDGKIKKLNDMSTLKSEILNPEFFNLGEADLDIAGIISEVSTPTEEKNERKRSNSDEEIKIEPQWIKCDTSCAKSLKPYIEKEIKSTAFMLRILSESVIDTTKYCTVKEDKIRSISGGVQDYNEDDIVEAKCKNREEWRKGIIKGKKIRDENVIEYDIEFEKGLLPLVFSYNNPQKVALTKLWEHDKQFFNLNYLDKDNRSSRLIMGLGPSASGKTYWATNVIRLLRMRSPGFPRSFLSVDGGLIRDKSFIYQDIIAKLDEHPDVVGLENLVSAGMGKKIFDAGKVKSAIKKYLLEESNRVSAIHNKWSHGTHGHPKIHLSPVSLYVPETLGGLDLPWKTTYAKGIKPYIKITGDDPDEVFEKKGGEKLKNSRANGWIGLYIWQSKTPKLDKAYVKKIKKENPNLQNEYIGSVSTTVSGSRREKKEGKKYSSTAYANSRSHGHKYIKKAPGGIIDIYNSGGATSNHPTEMVENKETKEMEPKKIFNKSIITEFPAKNNKGKYILDEDSVRKFNAIYIQKSSTSGYSGGGKKTRRSRSRSKSRSRTRKNNKKK